MTSARQKGLRLLLIGAALFVLLGGAFQRSTPVGMMDFKVLYYGARCLTHGCDPYNVGELERFYKADGGERPADPPVIRYVVTWYVYLPTTFLFTAPFSMLPWTPAHLLWSTVTAGAFILAAFLIWSVSANHAPVVSGWMIGFWLASSTVIFAGGNAVGLVVSLCAIAVFCFIRNRFVPAGILCLAISLVIKPHDAGLVWLYFLFAGGAYRKRALQTLALTCAFGLSALIWMSQASPHWFQEQTHNLAAISTHGGMNDPAPGSSVDRTAGLVIDLQSIISVFRDDPRFYNSISFAICGAFILVWLICILNSRSSSANSWYALAAIVPITMLVTYHKPYDAKLLLLTIPASLLLWESGGRIGRFAVFIEVVAIVFTADIPIAIFDYLTRSFRPDMMVCPASS